MTIHNEQHPLAQWLRRVADKLDLIYVRRQDPETGRWGNCSLADLDPGEASAWVALWLADGRIPVAAPRKEQTR